MIPPQEPNGSSRAGTWSVWAKSAVGAGRKLTLRGLDLIERTAGKDELKKAIPAPALLPVLTVVPGVTTTAVPAEGARPLPTVAAGDLAWPRPRSDALAQRARASFQTTRKSCSWPESPATNIALARTARAAPVGRCSCTPWNGPDSNAMDLHYFKCTLHSLDECEIVHICQFF